ncbi:MAG: hypothetical protein SAK29_36825 [Scytonema sp. PMC 1069.18]|nr:hypothetical protein [Scytonema sp. PMC 1069.18]MEC4887520.1 hypothetical protein [Scytonema sp. PMC 1070.18]
MYETSCKIVEALAGLHMLCLLLRYNLSAPIAILFPWVRSPLKEHG